MSDNVVIKEIKIKKFHNLEDVYLGKLSSFTVFFGQNNSGKTSLLDWLETTYSKQCNYVSMDEITYLFSDKEVLLSPEVVKLRQKAMAAMIEKFQKSTQKNLILHYFRELTGVDLAFSEPESGHDYFLVATTAGKYVRKSLYKLGNSFVAILACLVEMLWNNNPVILLDEPELSFHASLQKKMMKVLRHLNTVEQKQIFIATHSHLFLDRETPSNNYKISLNVGKKEIHQLMTMTDVVVAIYQLLGNTPDDLLLPNNFIIVEGQSDKIFMVHLLQRFFAKQLENKHLIIQPAHGDISNRQITNTMNYIDQFFSVLHGNPLYRDRAVILVDSQPGDVLEVFRNKYNLNKTRLRSLGEINAYSLEYAYPEETLWRVARRLKGPNFKRGDLHSLLQSIVKNKHNKKVFWADEIGLEIKREEVPQIFIDVIQTAIDLAY